MHPVLQYLIILCCAFAISACSTQTGQSGFWDQQQGAVKPTPPQSSADKIVLIYNHGTYRPQVIENCAAFHNQPPPSILKLQQLNPKIEIYQLCSKAWESSAIEDAGSYIYQRVNEVEATLDQLLASGVQAHNIFLVGHSAGGWTSLMAASRFPNKFNASIAFAPAFAGKRSEAKYFPWWRSQIRPQQIEAMLQAPRIKALVFAYEHDAYNRPQDLAFLDQRYPVSVELIAYDCGNHFAHQTHHYDCQAEQTTQRIYQYIQQQRQQP